MALQIVSEYNGIEPPEAYCRIRRTMIETPVSGNHSISVQVEVYASTAARAAKKQALSGMDFTFTDTPAKTEMKPKMDDEGFPIRDERDMQITESVETPANPAFTEMYTATSREGSDLKAIAYGSLKKRIKLFANSVGV